MPEVCLQQNSLNGECPVGPVLCRGPFFVVVLAVLTSYAAPPLVGAIFNRSLFDRTRYTGGAKRGRGEGEKRPSTDASRSVCPRGSGGYDAAADLCSTESDRLMLGRRGTPSESH